MNKKSKLTDVSPVTNIFVLEKFGSRQTALTGRENVINWSSFLLNKPEILTLNKTIFFF